MIAAIGDIHGELGKLNQLLEELESRLTKQDTVLFVGDYIDRGPDSRGVIDRIISLREERRVITLRGNHEQMMLDACGHFQQERGSRGISWQLALMWFENGAHQTLDSYPKREGDSWWERIPEEHWQFIRASELEYTQGPYHFVHAGILPRRAKWDEPELDPRLWIREPFLQSSEDFGKIIVFGHTPLKWPVFMENKIGIDTGAVFGGRLTAVILDPHQPYDPDGIEVVQV